MLPLKKLMKPEKIRITYLKRGDFGTVKDVKPRIKIRIAPLRPLRSIKNKGAKVIKTVARRIKL
jgi:S-adenosylmethionine decarboxylase